MAYTTLLFSFKFKFIYILTVILVVFNYASFSQTDSINNESLKEEILLQEDSTTIIISKGRLLIQNSFKANKKVKVAEVLHYFKTNPIFVNYRPVYLDEEWLLYHWTGQYENIISRVLENYSKTYNRFKIPPPRDLLYPILIDSLYKNRKDIKISIINSDYSAEDCAFLSLHFDWLLSDQANEFITQDTINFIANKFLNNYSDSKYSEFVRKYIKHEIEFSEWAFGFEFFSGYGFLTDELNDNFKNSIPMGVAFDISYMNYILYLRNYIGFSKTKQDLTFKGITWEKNKQARLFLPEASVGYTLLDQKNLSIAPFIGIASTEIGPTIHDEDNNPDLEDTGLTFTTTYTAGLNFDIKLAYTNYPIVTYRPNHSYWMLRIRYSYNDPQFLKKYGRFDGDFHSITIGFGGIGRAIKRKN